MSVFECGCVWDKFKGEIGEYCQTHQFEIDEAVKAERERCAKLLEDGINRAPVTDRDWAVRQTLVKYTKRIRTWC